MIRVKRDRFMGYGVKLATRHAEANANPCLGKKLLPRALCL